MLWKLLWIQVDWWCLPTSARPEFKDCPCWSLFVSHSWQTGLNHLSSPPPVHRNKAWNRMIQISIQGLQLDCNLIYGIPFQLLLSNFTSICNCTMLQLMEINERLKFSSLSFFVNYFYIYAASHYKLRTKKFFPRKSSYRQTKFSPLFMPLGS